MLRALRIAISLLMFGSLALTLGSGAHPLLNAANTTDANLERRFSQTVRPFVTSYCAGCHSGPTPSASLDLQRYSTMESVVEDFPHWALVLNKLIAREMPPQGMKQPPEELRRQVIAWITAVRKNEARRNAGDPGPVLARRLSNAEYNYTIRDLTGVDLRPAREFPVDPANQAGFDNSGESLTISPALMAKYLDAARLVADHLVLKPDGFSFAPHPMLVETDCEKYSIQRILDFYDRQPTDFAQYFEAAWRYKHRVAMGSPAATLADIAARAGVSPRYLGMVWQTLEGTKEEVGPLFKLQAMWRELPAPKGNQPDIAHEGCAQMRDFVVKIRRRTEKLFADVGGRGVDPKFQPLAMLRNRLLASHRRDFDNSALRVEGAPPPQGFVVTGNFASGTQESEELERAVAAYIKERQEDPDLVVPAGERARYESAFARFSSVFPSAFYLRERGRFYPITSMDKGRFLSAGFHNLMGYFRDDQPLIELILDEKGKRELDTLWEEFDFIADYTVRTYFQFIFNAGEGGGLSRNSGLPSQNDFATEAAIFRLRDRVLERVAPRTDPVTLQSIKDYFDRANTQIRWVERARTEAEPRSLDALAKFAARAYRRPLAQDERDDIFAYYRDLREKKGLTHEEAMRVSIASVLTSPDFLYRVDLVTPDFGASARSAHPTDRAAANGRRPLSGYSLASRLSYFIWSSMPDEELLSHAAAGDLSKQTVLVAQVRRMLKDSRARALATEFGGNWLDFRRFESHNAVDRERFPSFTNELREAMFEEPIRFITHLIQNDRPLLDLLYGDYTFVNGHLAKHYGMPAAPGGQDEWYRASDARSYGRGGLLPMAVFLTQNSPGLRTSPVKRGYWVARRALGEVIPPPPPVVPELPHDEAMSDLPAPALLAKHRENKMCASCHARFDSFGLAFEGYGPVGESRTRDLAGRPVDVQATFPGGVQGAGLDGLLSYIRGNREKDFLNNLSEKMLAFALGRSLLISDETLLDAMQAKLAASGYKMSALIETIVTSPQFLNRRSPELSQQRNSKNARQKGGK